MGQQVFKGVCERCGKEFESFVNPANKNSRKFCSKTCSVKAQHEKYRSKHGFDKGGKRPNFTGICKNCGKEFTRFVPPKNFKKALYCSTSCKSIYQWKDRKLTDADKTKVCEYCGKDFVYGKNNKSQRFCCFKCAIAKQVESGRENDRTLICEHCGKEFIRNLTDKEIAKGKGKYCSRECHNTHIAWTQIYCEQCGKPLKRGYGNKYCSHQCAGIAHRIEGGYKIPSGYIMATIEDGQRVFQHRYVMEQVLGRRLFDFERVHHKDGNRANNEPNNLELWLNGHPTGQRAQDLYKADVERLALELYNLKQKLNNQLSEAR